MVFPAEGASCVLLVNGSVAVRSLIVLGDTTLVNAQVEVIETVTLGGNLRFSVECTLNSSGVVATQTCALPCVVNAGTGGATGRLVQRPGPELERFLKLY